MASDAEGEVPDDYEMDIDYRSWVKDVQEWIECPAIPQIFWEISIEVIHPSIKPIVDEGKKCTSWSIAPGVFSQVV